MEISQLEPREVFRFFEEISRIPRGSGNTDAISAYCVSFAEERGLRAVKDPCGNVRIWKSVSYTHLGDFLCEWLTLFPK